MWPNWPKLASLTKKTWHFKCLQFCECVHCSQGSFLLESIYMRNRKLSQNNHQRIFLNKSSGIFKHVFEDNC